MTHKSVEYFATWEQAVEVLASILNRFPKAREVEYERGIAVQYYCSGPYYPQLEEKDGCDPRAVRVANPRSMANLKTLLSMPECTRDPSLDR